MAAAAPSAAAERGRRQRKRVLGSFQLIKLAAGATAAHLSSNEGDVADGKHVVGGRLLPLQSPQQLSCPGVPDRTAG